MVFWLGLSQAGRLDNARAEEATFVTNFTSKFKVGFSFTILLALEY